MRNKKLCRSQSFCLFLYLILMGLRAPACHINKARNWIAKPMLVKLAIRNCFWWWWRWWWVKMFWIFNCTCKIYGTEILFSDIVRVFWVDKLIKNWRHIQNIKIENLLQIKMIRSNHYNFYFLSYIQNIVKRYLYHFPLMLSHYRMHEKNPYMLTHFALDKLQFHAR